METVEEKYEILGGVISKVTTVRTPYSTVEELVANIESKLSFYSGIVPQNCIFMAQKNDHLTYVVELPAQMVPVSFSARSGRTKLNISIPFTQFYIVFDERGNMLNMYISVTKEPIKSLDDVILISPYLNIHDQGRSRVCTGSITTPVGVPQHVRCNALVSQFFTADFNNDLTPAIPAGITGNRETYMLDWHEKSKIDRFFGVSDEVTYPEMPRSDGSIFTFQRRIDYILEENGAR